MLMLLFAINITSVKAFQCAASQFLHHSSQVVDEFVPRMRAPYETSSSVLRGGQRLGKEEEFLGHNPARNEVRKLCKFSRNRRSEGAPTKQCKGQRKVMMKSSLGWDQRTSLNFTNVIKTTWRDKPSVECVPRYSQQPQCKSSLKMRPNHVSK